MIITSELLLIRLTPPDVHDQVVDGAHLVLHGGGYRARRRAVPAPGIDSTASTNTYRSQCCEGILENCDISGP